jgi:hypothetical protein
MFFSLHGAQFFEIVIEIEYICFFRSRQVKGHKINDIGVGRHQVGPVALAAPCVGVIANREYHGRALALAIMCAPFGWLRHKSSRAARLLLDGGPSD